MHVEHQVWRLAREAAVGACVLAAACNTTLGTSQQTMRCPSGTGEFPPTDCAVVEGRAVDGDGNALAQLGLRVDSLEAAGYAYTSDAAVTDSTGGFRLVVLRVNRFRPPADPDTATIAVKAYDSANPLPGASPIASAMVQMRFAPADAPVEPVHDTLTFDLRR